MRAVVLVVKSVSCSVGTMRAREVAEAQLSCWHPTPHQSRFLVTPPGNGVGMVNFGNE